VTEGNTSLPETEWKGIKSGAIRLDAEIVPALSVYMQVKRTKK
jgi:hypothetical protein